MRARRAGAGVLLAAVVLAGLAGPAAADDEPAERPGRLLVISVPGLEWADLEDRDLPTLEAFFAQAALADLAPRGVAARSGPGDAYLTISAGARSTTARSVDGQVLALDEQSSGSAAGEIFTRRTGLTPEGGFVSLSWSALLEANDDEPYDAVPGLLADRLAAAGISVAAVGNADGTDSIGTSYERQVGLALADLDGVLADGALGKDLTRDDPSRPFGVRLDPDAVVDRFTEAWAASTPDGDHRGGVVLVEASDLARTLRYRPMVSAGRYLSLWQDAVGDTDALVARLLDQVDPARDSVLVLAPYNRVGDRDLTVVGLRRPGGAPGYLFSASTQRSGFLTLVDVGPTILDTFGVARPVDMEGRPAKVRDSSSSYERRVDRLVARNEASRFRERLLVPTTMAVVVGFALLTAAGMAVLAGRWREPWPRLVRFAARADLALLPASYLARGFPLEDLGVGFYWPFIVIVALAVAAGSGALRNRLGRRHLDLVLVLSLVGLVLVGDVVSGSRLSLSAAFGYSPTGNSRLYGISNYSFGQLAVVACLLAAMLAGARRGLRGRYEAVGLLVATLVVIGVPIWGSDVGGILAFTPTVGLFAVLLFGLHIRVRTLVVGLAATAIAVTGFGLLDLARPPEERAHLGRLFERIGDEGLQPLLSIMERKLLANLEVSTESTWVVAIPIAIAFGIFLVHFPGRPVDRLREHLPTLGIGVWAAVLAAALGSAVNDSGAIVGGVSAMVLTASLVHLCLDVQDDGDPVP